jgi:3-dehydroquinate dehydratase
MLAPAAVGIVAGLGTSGYELALRGLVTYLRARSAVP